MFARHNPPPPPSLRALPLWHGMHNAEGAATVLATGMLLPGDETGAWERKGYRPRGFQTPQRGMSYLTTELGFALTYALGGCWAGHKFAAAAFVANAWWAEEIAREPFGYVFRVRGETLRDVEPDEDSIGEAVAEVLLAEIGSTRTPAPGFPNTVLSDPVLVRELAWTAHRWLSALQQRRLRDGLAAWQSRAGKTLARRLAPEARLRLLELGAHVAHRGPLPVDQVWQVSRVRCGDLNADGSNFAQYAALLWQRAR